MINDAGKNTWDINFDVSDSMLAKGTCQALPPDASSVPVRT